MPEPAAVRVVPRYRDGVARARCHQCDAELVAGAPDASQALAALHALLIHHGWGVDRQGRRLCDRHLGAGDRTSADPPPETAA